jgi:hypothetical protein
MDMGRMLSDGTVMIRPGLHRVVALIALTATAHCSNEPRSGGVSGDAAIDATDEIAKDDVDEADLEGPDPNPDPVDEDTGGPWLEAAVSPTPGQWVEVRQTDGAAVSGEVIAVYDHSVWWVSSDDLITVALFDPALLAEYPDDRSMTFLRWTDGVESWRVLPGEDRASYVESLRHHGVVSGRVPINGVVRTLMGGASYHLEEEGFGDFAWDFGISDAELANHSGDGTRNEDYYVWGDAVHLPVGGTLVDIVRDSPDNAPSAGPAPLGAVNNWVGIQVYGAFYLYLLHMRQDSIPISLEVGDYLAAGTYVGDVGNSGVTLVPHLHMSLLWYDCEAERSWSVPLEFADIYAGESAVGGTLRSYVVPVQDTWISNEPF